MDSLHSVKCNVAECFPEKSSWCRNEQVCQFERSNGLETALYKCIPFMCGVLLIFGFWAGKCLHISVATSMIDVYPCDK